MSLSLILVPAAIAAVGAAQAARKPKELENRHGVATVTTRMRNVDLLGRALTETGASVTATDDSLDAVWQDTRASFTRDEQGIWTAHFPDDVDPDLALARIRAVDASYGLQVQAEVLQRLRDRAGDANMSVASEKVEEDNSVTVVLNVNQVAS